MSGAPRSAVAVAAALALAATAAAAARAPTVSSARPAAAADLHAEVRALDARLAVLERRLGLRSDTVAGTSFHARYAALRARERAVAARAEAWLRWVPSSAPVAGGVVSSAFSPARLHPIRRRVMPHVGVDIAAPHGAAVRATADGTVLATVDHPTYGLTVDVRHGASGFVTRYAHLSRIAVRPGEAVERGTLLGRVGQSGLATGPHLHYELFHGGWRRDPIDFLPPGPVAGEALPRGE